MLKIKDDVDLKELEKFDFEDNFNGEAFIVTHSDGMTEDYLSVDKKDKTIQLGHYQDEHGGTWINGIGDLLFDLIQAGLVEKVGGEDEQTN